MEKRVNTVNVYFDKVEKGTKFFLILLFTIFLFGGVLGFESSLLNPLTIIIIPVFVSTYYVKIYPIISVIFQVGILLAHAMFFYYVWENFILPIFYNENIDRLPLACDSLIFLISFGKICSLILNTFKGIFEEEKRIESNPDILDEVEIY